MKRAIGFQCPPCRAASPGARRTRGDFGQCRGGHHRLSGGTGQRWPADSRGAATPREGGRGRGSARAGDGVLSRLPNPTARDLVRTLENAGFEERHQRGSHLHLYRPARGRWVTVPMHRATSNAPCSKPSSSRRAFWKPTISNCFEGRELVPLHRSVTPGHIVSREFFVCAIGESVAGLIRPRVPSFTTPKVTKSGPFMSMTDSWQPNPRRKPRSA